MPAVALKYVHTFVDRHGRLRSYFRRAGVSTPLPDKPGSPAFMLAYHAAATADVARKAAGAGADRTVAGTISALVADWYASAGFRTLRPSTKATYRGVVERFRADHGTNQVAGLQAKHIYMILDRKADTPAAARNLLRMIRLLMRFAVERGWRKDDPTASVRQRRTTTEGFHTWSDDEIARFEAFWPLGTRARLAMALLLYTGQRRSDVVRMGRQHVSPAGIAVCQQKTGVRLTIPVHSELQAALDAAPSDNLTFLTTPQGSPLAVASFGNWFRQVAAEAGLPAGRTAHGLRKAAARQLAEAGCTIHQIAAVTGHKSLAMVGHYTRAADQAALATQATAMRGRAKTNG